MPPSTASALWCQDLISIPCHQNRNLYLLTSQLSFNRWTVKERRMYPKHTQSKSMGLILSARQAEKQLTVKSTI